MTGVAKQTGDINAQHLVLTSGVLERFGLAQVAWSWLLALPLGLAATLSTSLATAQDEAEVEGELVIEDGFEIAESNFDQWIFGVQYSDQGLKRVESLLSLQVEAIDRACGLSEQQVAKLSLAGQGDIKRFYDDVAVARDKFMKVRRDRNAFNNVWQDIQPLQTRINAGLFNDASFFHKVVRRVLNDEQRSNYEEAEWARKQFHYQAKLALAVTIMERSMPLRAQQREQFLQVLQDETQPPTAFGASDYYFILYQLGTIPDQKLKSIFDDAQWKVLKQFTERGRGMEVWLKQQQVLP